MPKTERPNRKLVSFLALAVVAVLILVGGLSCEVQKKTFTDAYCESGLDRRSRSAVIEGSIVDLSGTYITRADAQGVSGELVPDHYDHIVGFNDPDRGSFGLRGKLADYLYSPGKDGRGAQVTLTIDDRLQQYVGHEMRDINGSVIVLKRETGRILALVSNSAESRLDVDDIYETAPEEVREYMPSVIPYGYGDSETPGSVFKIITACAIIENGRDSEIYNDTGLAEIGAYTIRNAHHRSYGEVDLKEAFAHSVNTYFSTMSAGLGCDIIEQKGKDFLLGQDIPLDFTTLRSVMDLKADLPEMAAITGYGQGYTQVTPLHMAMIASAIANDGVMLRPYLIDSISLDDKTLLEGKSEELARPVTAETAAQVKSIMHYTAVDSYGMADEKYGTLCAKTGTAELTNGMNHAYLVTFNDNYVVVASRNDTMTYGIELKELVLKVYDRLIELGTDAG